ncbi:hypothetical protein BHE74_00040762 [Ensete ventricosum]|nr:hypothetical protein GW17_00044935 [Ensete ventricosum]RWW52798.1 hypothetical protein BHE74_00040762 [Ensete ventricosum]RZS09899.1 hypothetical protein BHM03_00041029 [Ensete ventricosum]
MMSLARLRGMPKVLIGKPRPVARATIFSPEVQEIPVEAAPKVATSLTPKRPTKGEGSSRAHSKGKEPVASGGEPVKPTYYRPKSIKELCKTTMRTDNEGYYALKMIDLPPQDPDSEMWDRWEALKNSARVWDDP